MSWGKAEDLVGKKFGRLTVIYFAGFSSKRNAKWRCRCSCGQHHTVLAYNLKNGAVQSCGCLRTDFGKTNTYRHGMSGTTEYRIWNMMIQRCFNKQHPAYKNYGARGIKVLKRWLTFENFYADMGRRPAHHTLDRVDNNWHYTKSNCRWATKKQQARNGRNNRFLKFKGQTLCISAWAEKLKISASMINRRLKRGWSVQEALTIKPRSIRHSN